MRHCLPAAVLLLLSLPPASAQAPQPAPDPGGISMPALSSCLARIALDDQSGGSAYAAVAFDGLPWLKVETVDARLGSQAIWARAAGSGMWWQHDGTAVPLRFVCQVDADGKALKLQASPIIASRDEPLPPYRLMTGTVTWAASLAAPADSEVRLQLLDESASRSPAIIAEQVVRVAQDGPVAFALRLWPDATLASRSLTLDAVVVQNGFVRAGLRQVKRLAEADLQGPIALTLE